MNWSNIVIGIILLIFAALYYLSTLGFPPPSKMDNLGSAFFPELLTGALVLLSVLLILTSVFRGRGSEDDGDAAVIKGAERLEEDSFVAENISWKSLFAAVGLPFIYVGMIPILGYLICTPLFLIALIRLLGYEKWVNNVAASVGLTAALYLLFVTALGVRLPEGIFFS
jgi:hypothetical protein